MCGLLAVIHRPLLHDRLQLICEGSGDFVVDSTTAVAHDDDGSSSFQLPCSYSQLDGSSSETDSAPLAFAAPPMAHLLSPKDTPVGTLPPFEVAKAFAFHTALAQIEKHTGMSSRQLLGEDKKAFIARHLHLEGGGRPGFTAVTYAIKKCREQGWELWHMAFREC